MKSFYASGNANQSTLIEEEIPSPHAGVGELLIRVYAAGVTPTELLWYPTWHNKTGEKRYHPVPGHEFSGVVADVGERVSGISVGDEIFGMNDWFANGATAEYCVTLPSSIAPKPSRLSHAEAASIPIGALTAWQGLFDRAKLQAGERVFIQGGAGAVGVFAVQLAHFRCAEVVASASPGNLDFVRNLGADEVIDYRTDYFQEKTASFDVVFDVVGGGTLEKSWPLLRPGGRMVTIAAQSEQPANERVKDAFFIVEPNRRQLVEISAMIDSGRLLAVVDKVVPLAAAANAYTARLSGESRRGKVVLQI